MNAVQVRNVGCRHDTQSITDKILSRSPTRYLFYAENSSKPEGDSQNGERIRNGNISVRINIHH